MRQAPKINKFFSADLVEDKIKYSNNYTETEYSE